MYQYICSRDQANEIKWVLDIDYSIMVDIDDKVSYIFTIKDIRYKDLLRRKDRAYNHILELFEKVS